MEVIRVPHPERWWFARADDLPWLVNPDAERPRWADRDTRQWGAIAPIVDGLARTLSAGRYDVEDGRAVLHADLSALEETDRNIVRSWFQAWQAPSADTWSTTMSDGRHRCWNSWRALPGALLPLSSALLEHADHVHESAENLRLFRDNAARGVATLPQEVADRAPLYLAELRRAAATEVPDDTREEEARALSSPARVLPDAPAAESLAKRIADLLLARRGAVEPADTRRPRGLAATDHHRHRREDPPAGPAGRERS